MQIRKKLVSTFLLGKLRSQFNIDNLQDLKGKYVKQGQFRLCEPFFLFDAVEIDQETAEKIRKSNRQQKSLIETTFDSTDFSKSIIVKKKDSEIEIRKIGLYNIYMYGNIEGVKHLKNSDSPANINDEDAKNESSIDLHTPFLVNSNDLHGGRVLGDAIIELREFKDFKIEETPKNTPTESIVIEQKTKCIALTKAGTSCKLDSLVGSDFCHLHQPSETAHEIVENKGGCFGRDKASGLISESSYLNRRFFGPLGIDREGVNGFFSGTHSRPSGCFSPSMPMWRRRGCGCMSFLPLLLILALLYCLFFGDCGCKSNDNSQYQPPKHDTVYVEVVKERIDTLKIVQMDTVSMIDSTSSIITQMVPLPNVQFKTNSDILLPSSAKDLSKLAEHLEKNDSLTALIKGHTDSTGSEEYNIDLSQRRAEAVKKYLISLGIDPNRIKAKGLGSAESKADNSTLEGRLMNRRVEVILESTINTKKTLIPKKDKSEIIQSDSNQKQ